MAKISTMMQSDLDIADSISEFETSDAYRNAKYAPSEPVLPLQSGEDLYVHESVAACRYSRLYVTRTSLTKAGFSCTWSENGPCAQG